MAGEAGREVMAIPGSPLDPRAKGCNQLIRDGATLVQNARDVLEALQPSSIARVADPPEPFAPTNAEPSESQRSSVLDLLGPIAVGVDEIVRQSGASPADVQLVLLELDLAGKLERHAGGKVSLPA